MLDRFKVYCASAYTKPDPGINTNAAMKLWDQLIDLGFAPFCPHWSHFQHAFSPRDYSLWLAYDLVWLTACDVVLRTPGESSGADAEVTFARERGIPVVYSVASLQDWAASMKVRDTEAVA